MAASFNQDISSKNGSYMFQLVRDFKLIQYTLKCLSIGTPKTINFPWCPSIQAHCNEAVIYLNFGTSKNNKFSIWNKWKIYYFTGVPILKHIRVQRE